MNGGGQTYYLVRMRGEKCFTLHSGGEGTNGCDTRGTELVGEGAARVTVAEVERVATAYHQQRFRLAGAITLLVAAPAVWLALLTYTLTPAAAFSRGVALWWGGGLWLGSVAVAAAQLLQRTAAITAVVPRHWQQGGAKPPAVAWGVQLAESHDLARRRRLLVARSVWGGAVVVLILAGLSAGTSGMSTLGYGAAASLLLTAVGLGIYLPATWATGVARRLRVSH